jgi:hypothetical protein
MSDTAQLVELLRLQIQQQQEQMQHQREQMQEQMQHQREQMQQQLQHQQEQTEQLVATLKGMGVGQAAANAPPAMPTFTAFDSTAELFSDYWARFAAFAGAHSVPSHKTAQVFLASQSPVIFKLLSNLASLRQPPIDVNMLPIEEIEQYMMEQFHPRRFVIRERYRFWSNLDRKPGESVLELAARIRADAVTCEFSSIKNPLDDALRTRFMIAVNNEAVLKTFFRMKDEELSFAQAVELAVEVEAASANAKETVYHAKGANPLNAVKQRGAARGKLFEAEGKAASSQSSRWYLGKGAKPPADSRTEDSAKEKRCVRCDRLGHSSDSCQFRQAVCSYCQRTGHIQVACRKRKARVGLVTAAGTAPAAVNSVRSVPQLQQALELNGKPFTFEIDTGASACFISKAVWKRLGKPPMAPVDEVFKSASSHVLPVLGTIKAAASVPSVTASDRRDQTVQFVVTEVPHLNLLGRDAIRQLRISVDSLIHATAADAPQLGVHRVFDKLQPDLSLQKACRQVCEEFPDLFKRELGCLKDFELEVKFKPDAKPVFRKPRPVPFAILDDLTQAYEAGIAKKIWQPVQFNDYGTPVVPITKASLPGQDRPRIRVCGDYSATVNPQLETHHHPMPRPEELMQRLSGGYFFTKIDLADAYNQIALAPESQKRLALSTHRGVLLQKRLPFGISSAPGYFQEIMEKLTYGLPRRRSFPRRFPDKWSGRICAFN